MWGATLIFVIGMNSVYYGLKSCIFVEVDVLFVSGKVLVDSTYN